MYFCKSSARNVFLNLMKSNISFLHKSEKWIHSDYIYIIRSRLRCVKPIIWWLIKNFCSVVLSNTITTVCKVLLLLFSFHGLVCHRETIQHSLNHKTPQFFNVNELTIMTWWGHTNFSDSPPTTKGKTRSHSNIYSMVLLIILMIKYKLQVHV